MVLERDCVHSVDEVAFLSRTSNALDHDWRRSDLDELNGRD